MRNKNAGWFHPAFLYESSIEVNRIAKKLFSDRDLFRLFLLCLWLGMILGLSLLQQSAQ